LDREDAKRGSLDAAQARIDILKENRSLEGKFERYCQVEHLQALILLDQGKVKEACKILQSLLYKQVEKGRNTNNRSLLWVRLTLATIIRNHGEKDTAPLFSRTLLQVLCMEMSALSLTD
jgi:hypothetical protein